MMAIERQFTRRPKGMFGNGLPSFGAASSYGPEQQDMPNPSPSTNLGAAAPAVEPFTPRKPKALGVLSDFLSGVAGGQANYSNGLHADNRAAAAAAQQRAAQAAEWQRQDAQRMQDRDWTVEDAQRKENAPQFFMSNGDRVRYDPVTGQAAPVYDAPEPFEAYAATLGLDPGTPEYTQAVQDYVLKSSGPTAFGYDRQLDDYRTNNDIRRKGAPTYRQTNPAPPRPSRARSSGSSPHRSSSSARRTATNPTTGQTITFNPASGKWE